MADVKKTVIIDLKATGDVGQVLDQLLGKFTGLSRELSKVVGPIDKLVKSLSGATIPDSLSKTLDSIKKLDGIKLPSVTAFAKGIEKLSGLSMPSVDKFVTELKKFNDIKIPGVLQLANGLIKLSDSAININQAATNIKAFIGPLTRLSTIKLDNVAQVATGIERLSKISFNAGASQQVYQFVDAITKLNNIKVPNIQGIAKGFEQLRGFKDPASKVAQNIDQLVLALNKLSGVSLPGVNKFVSGLRQLEKLNVQTITQRITELAAAIKVLDQSGTLKHFATFAQDLRNLHSQLNSAAGPLQRIQNTLQQYGNAADTAAKKTKGFGERLQNYMQYRIIADTIMGLQNAFGGTIDVLKQYDQALKDLQAITGATDVEVGMMGETIKRVAVQAKFSLTEIAEGMRTFGQAGFSASETMKAIQAVSDLATGTLSDLALTVDLVSTAMKVFDISAENSARVADVFANAVNKSKLNIDKIRTAFNYVGPVADEAGVSFEESIYNWYWSSPSVL